MWGEKSLQRNWEMDPRKSCSKRSTWKVKLVEKKVSKKKLQRENLLHIFLNWVKEELNCSNPNERVPAVVDAVALKHDEKFGRHLVTARDIKLGEFYFGFYKNLI